MGNIGIFADLLKHYIVLSRRKMDRTLSNSLYCSRFFRAIIQFLIFKPNYQHFISVIHDPVSSVSIYSKYII